MNGFFGTSIARSFNSRRSLIPVAAGTIIGSLVGCASPARPNDRADPYSRPGDAALNDPAVSPRTLLEFTDQVTMSLADRIPRVADIKDSPQKAVIAVGAITNRTRTPANDFAAIRSQIFSDLVNSTVSDHAIILDTIETMDEQIKRYAPRQQPDRLDEGNQREPESARYDPNITYILNGEFSEISRDSGRDSTYIFVWKLVNLGSSKQVYSDRILSTQTRTR
jgi:hypothetical protein